MCISSLRRFISTINYSKDYYKVLNSSKTSSKSDMRKAYIALAKEFHPDTPTGNAEKFKAVAEAWEILGNDQLKKQYDQGRATGTFYTSYAKQSAKAHRDYKSYDPFTHKNYTYRNDNFYHDFRKDTEHEFFKRQQEYYKQKTYQNPFQQTEKQYKTHFKQPPQPERKEEDISDLTVALHSLLMLTVIVLASKLVLQIYRTIKYPPEAPTYHATPPGKSQKATNIELRYSGPGR